MIKSPPSQAMQTLLEAAGRQALDIIDDRIGFVWAGEAWTPVAKFRRGVACGIYAARKLDFQLCRLNRTHVASSKQLLDRRLVTSHKMTSIENVGSPSAA